MAGMDQARDQADLVKDKAKSAIGGALGDDKLEAEGEGGQVVDRLQSAFDRRREEINDRLAQVESFAKSRPWAALWIAALGGLILGRLTTKHKVVYVNRLKPSEVR